MARSPKEKLPQISDAEWEVMKAVWAGGSPTAGEVVDAVRAERAWNPRTIKTLLGRLVKKRAVEAIVDGRRYLYRARVSRNECIRQESRSFLARVFDGAVGPAVLHFIEDQKLTPDELAQLKRILEQEGKDA